jgi:hypothetical protein
MPAGFARACCATPARPEKLSKANRNRPSPAGFSGRRALGAGQPRYRGAMRFLASALVLRENSSK